MKKASNDISLEEVLDYEKIRYQRKGYGLIVAGLIVIIWFLVVPNLAQYIWPYKIENKSVFFFIFSYVLHQICFLLNNFLMWVIYKLELPFFERYKCQDKPWPWKDDPAKWNQLLKDTAWNILLNQFVLLPAFFLGFLMIKDVEYRMDYESLPSSFEVIWQTVFSMLIEDFCFYWAHRFLHWDKIYPYIHKTHHRYVNSVSISSEYAHPFEFLFVNVLISSSGSAILGSRMHMVTYIMWIFLRVAETTDGHCGYEFSWSPYRLLPMSASSEYHNYHHLVFKGNYASFFTYMDRLCGTVGGKYDDFVAKKLEYQLKSQSKTEETKKEN
jgi:sterol desaturase/sphingolipid hydroxylase (fatty acid hydroxylase superfamily)